jgi:predicted RNA-binding protein
MMVRDCEAEVEDLVGRVVSDLRFGVEGVDLIMEDGESISLVVDSGDGTRLTDIAGDLDLLVGSPLRMAYQFRVNQGNIAWIMYNLATYRGYVSLRWKSPLYRTEAE